EPIRQRNLALGIWFLGFGSYEVDAFSTPQEKNGERSKKFSRRLLVVSSGFRKCGERKSSPPTKIFWQARAGHPTIPFLRAWTIRDRAFPPDSEHDSLAD